MPYDLHRDSPTRITLRLWPHNALPPRGFVTVIGLSAVTLALPMIAVLGSPVVWGLLPFAGLALWGLWFALQRNWRDRSLREDMTLTRNEVHLIRTDPDGRQREWRADPHWVALHLRPRGGPVPAYLTLTGGGREVELGAFLTPDERTALFRDLDALLMTVKSYHPGR
jgi:uncharacterized membrane protein